jgi:LacI family transcriptional regulator
MRSRPKRRVALIYHATSPFEVKVIMGVATYLQERAHYSVHIEENALGDQPLPDLRSWGGDGVIADLDDPEVARLVVQSALPAVGFGCGCPQGFECSSIPYFQANNRAIARLAADHLLDRGLSHFAYVGYPPTPTNGWSEERQNEFVKRITSWGFQCPVFIGRHVFGAHEKSTRHWATMQRELGTWLGTLPRPLGVMAANDNRGRHVLDACAAYNLQVPEDVAVIGVDNDELLCTLSSPALSSVEQGGRALGYAAATLLHDLLEGRKSRRRRFVFDPVGVVTRRSTDVSAIDDVNVQQAMAFIREHACKGIKVPDVVAATSISRSGLEARFASVLGCTIHTAIRRNQVDSARKLILQTDMPLKRVAVETGFRSVQHMTSVFGKIVGQTPARYRMTEAHTVPRDSNGVRRRNLEND